MALWPISAPVTPIVIISFGRYSIGREMAAMAQAAPIEDTMLGATLCVLIPFRVPEQITVKKMFIHNGGTLGNVDVGIYNLDGTRIVSNGSVAQANASALQEFDITDTVLPAGRYYMALANSQNTSYMAARTFGNAVDLNAMRVMGVCMGTNAFPLQATVTPFVAFGQSGEGGLPLMGLSTRTLVV